MTDTEKRALAVCCPVCRAGSGRPCLNMGSVNTDFGRLTLKHPHRERIAEVREVRQELRLERG